MRGHGSKACFGPGRAPWGPSGAKTVGASFARCPKGARCAKARHVSPEGETFHICPNRLRYETFIAMSDQECTLLAPRARCLPLGELCGGPRLGHLPEGEAAPRAKGLGAAGATTYTNLRETSPQTTNMLFVAPTVPGGPFMLSPGEAGRWNKHACS